MSIYYREICTVQYRVLAYNGAFVSNSSRNIFGVSSSSVVGLSGLSTAIANANANANATVSSSYNTNSYGYPGMSSAIPRQQYMAFTYWSSVDIPRNVSPNNPLYLFNTALNNGSTLLGGNRVPTLIDTNMRERGQLNQEFLCTYVKWLLVPTPEPDGNLERLSEAQDPAPDDPAKEMCNILQNAVIQWDFAQTLIDIAPLWLKETAQNIVIPEMATFRLRLTFSPGLPEFLGKYTLRVAISGQGPTPVHY